MRAGGARGIGTSLRMTARLRTIGAVTLGRVSGMGGEIERLDPSADPLSYDITYVLRGGFDYLDGGSWRPLEGVVKMGPTGVPNRMRLSGRSAFVFARIEKSRLLRSVVELPETFRVYRRMTLADHALAGMIPSVLGEEIEPAEGERAPVERSVVEFAGGVFRGRLGQQADARSPHDALRDRARIVIGRRAGEAAFGPREVAEEVGISLRQLQAIFARAGSSPGAEIRLERTRIAHGILSDPGQDHLSLVQVSELSGFGSVDSMRRALEARYGAGPSTLRVERSRPRP
mgnify:CR=1 FL=1